MERGLGLIADRRPMSSCCSRLVFIEYARRALILCLHCRIVVIGVVGAASLQVTWHLVLVGCLLQFILWRHSGPIVCCSW